MALISSKLNTSFRSNSSSSPIFQGIVALAVLILFSWFLLRPWLSKAMETKTELKQAQQQLANLESDQVELNNLINKLKSSSKEVALVDEALPLNGRVSKVNVLLSNLVRSSGMTLAILSTDDSQTIISAGDKEVLQNPYKPGRTLYTITTSASITGTMEQLKNLLQLMETNGRVLDVDTLQIIGGEPATKFRITVKAYAYENVTKKL